jgi:ubiquinone/menaquinone biosynthesis C-methylase UbiE
MGTSEELNSQAYYPYIKNFFKKYSRIYDIMVILLTGIRRKTVAMTGAVKGAKILDIATGTGKQAYAYAQKGFNVTGIDLSEDMLDIARKHNKYPNLKLESGDATKLPYEDNHFDVTCVSFALHDMPPEIREKVVEEMLRVTKAGGTVMVVDYGLPKNSIVRFFAYRFINSFESIYYAGFVKNDLVKMLEKYGFKKESEKGVLFGAGRIVRGVKGESNK